MVAREGEHDDTDVYADVNVVPARTHTTGGGTGPRGTPWYTCSGTQTVANALRRAWARGGGWRPGHETPPPPPRTSRGEGVQVRRVNHLVSVRAHGEPAIILQEDQHVPPPRNGGNHAQTPRQDQEGKEDY